MDDGKLYTISDDYKIKAVANRTKMKNNFWCQAYGEWFDERSPLDGKPYETPFDPKLTTEEINRVRNLLCLDAIESRRKRRPWVNVVSIRVFEELIN